MTQRYSAAPGRGDAASLIYIGGQFESHAIVTNEEHIIDRDADLLRTPINHTHKSRHPPDMKKPASNGSEGITVRRRQAPAKRPHPGSDVHRSGQTASSATSSQIGMAPMQHWHSEAAQAQPWNGLGNVTGESGTTTEGSQTGERSKNSSMETCKDTASRASLNDNSHRNGRA